MRILVIGSGGREHAIAWALARSPQRPDLYIAPGNAGTAALGQNIPIPPTDISGLLAFARQERISLTIVGPEVPLVEGVVDAFESAEHAVVGPTAQAARIEGSKAFAKAFMARHGVPTAAYRTFSVGEYAEAVAYLKEQGAPIVIKASGLAAGKGAIVCATEADALAALDTVMHTRAFGEAGDEVVIEAFMEGEEASVFALSDGKDYVLLAPAQDHKRVGEGDTGPNTGGVGAYAPAPLVTPKIMRQVCRDVIEPTLAGMAQEGYPYRGILYAGIMMTAEGPQVVEFNCRMGDPETQIVLPLLDSDLVEVFQMLTERRLGEVKLKARPGAAACVVMASGGYPGSYTKGYPITGLRAASKVKEVVVFHAGTALDEEGRCVTAGGRVLGVTATGKDLASALNSAYEAVELIDFEGAQYRRDIGQKGLAHLNVSGP